jgi:hypothetical protein
MTLFAFTPLLAEAPQAMSDAKFGALMACIVAVVACVVAITAIVYNRKTIVQAPGMAASVGGNEASDMTEKSKTVEINAQKPKRMPKRVRNATEQKAKNNMGDGLPQANEESQTSGVGTDDKPEPMSGSETVAS